MYIQRAEHITCTGLKQDDSHSKINFFEITFLNKCTYSADPLPHPFY